ncbi:MAG: hypothetical protein ACHQD6_02300 [Steroidobacterales bacterium]|jgi:hypothetical protein
MEAINEKVTQEAQAQAEALRVQGASIQANPAFLNCGALKSR